MATGDVVTMRVSGPIGAVIAAAAPHGIVDVVSREPNLEDVFLAQYGEHPVELGRAGRVTSTATTRGRSARPGPWSRVVGLGTIYGKTAPRQPAGGAGRRRRRRRCS